MHMIKLLHLMIALGLLGGLGSCGGGGGTSAPPPATFNLNTHSLSFSAPGPFAATPADQTVTASVSGTLTGTLYLLVTTTGSAVANVSNFTVAGSSGQGSVSVPPPSSLGIGTHSGTISVRACLNSATCASGELSGSPQSVAVSYVVNGPVLPSTVMPHAVTAGLAGQVVLRGSGFTGTTALSFGNSPATGFTVVSDSLIQASYPATLTPGSYALTLSGNSVAFAGSIVAVPTQGYAATKLSYPEAPERILATVFDAERQSLYIAATFATTSSNKLWQYKYSGGAWSAAHVITIPELRDVALSSDGTRLYVLTSNAVLELDAANPQGSALRTVAAPFTGSGIGSAYLVGFAFANDGTALVATAYLGQNSLADTYVYSVAAGTFTDLGGTTQLPTDPSGVGAGLVASADGSLVVATQPDTFRFPKALEYNPEKALVSPVVFTIQQFPGSHPAALDAGARRIATTDQNNLSICDAAANFLGYLNTIGFGLQRVVVVNPQGSRAFVLTAQDMLLSFDLSATPSGAPASYPAIGPAIAQAVPALISQYLRTAVTPDGATLFIAGDGGVAIIAAPN
jgi:hypothetical protein